MKRRVFITKTGLISTGVVMFPLVAASSKYNFGKTVFNPTELRNAIDRYLSKTFNNKPDENIIPPDGRFYFASSYDVDVNTDKNDIYSVADKVITKCKLIGFDAAELKLGNIPDGMQILNGGIIINKDSKFSVLKIEGLNNFDARVTFRNCINFKTEVPIREWKNLRKVEKIPTSNGYVGNLRGVFRVWMIGDFFNNISFESIDPIRLSQNCNFTGRCNSGFLNEFLSQEVFNLI